MAWVPLADGIRQMVVTMTLGEMNIYVRRWYERILTEG